jgi:hypothetical protein
LEQFGITADAARPELIVKKNTDRQRSSRRDDLALVKATYCRVFLNQTLTGTQDAWETLARRIESEGFDTFWTVEEFEDCEDVDDLVADLKQSEQSEGVRSL